MYLHLGQNTVIKTGDIIGIFDIDTCTISKNTKQFLAHSEKKNRVVNVSTELPKSFIVAKNSKTNHNNVYISQLSASTMKKRSNKKLGLNLL